MAIREGKWDCPQCGAKGNRGAEQKCAACGRVRGEEVRFYLEDEAPEVSDAALLAKAAAGADWLCEFCQASNQAGFASCRSCGAERTGKRREVRETAATPPAPAPAPAPKKGRGKLWTVLGLAAVLGAYWLISRPSEQAMTVASLSWERTIAVEKHATVVESGWRDELPAGARVQSTERRFHHNEKVQTGTRQETRTVQEEVPAGTRKVKVGTRDKGNGFFEDVYREEPVTKTRSRQVVETVPVYRDDPITKDWCTYEIEKWVPDRVERAAGDDRSPRWPEVRLADRQREGARKETYRAVLRDGKGKERTWEPALAVWSGLESGKGYRVVVRMGKVEGLAP